jgi:hypothetical protein
VRPVKPLQRSTLEASIGIIATIVLAVVPMPYPARCVALLVAAAISVHVIWLSPYTIDFARWFKSLLASVPVLIAGAIAFVLMPQRSFVFLVPGAWINDNSWMFVVQHRGPEPLYNVTMIFQDRDRADRLRQLREVSPEDIVQTSRSIHFDEIDPGLGTGTARRFVWRPLDHDHEHFAIRTGHRNGTIDEILWIERVGGKWQYALKVSDPINDIVLLECMDPDFPHDRDVRMLDPCSPAVLNVD